MIESEDWMRESDGEQSLKPDTDEFGRDDLDSLARERRRREREQRRRKQRERPRPKGKSGGFLGGLLGRGRGERPNPDSTEVRPPDQQRSRRRAPRPERTAPPTASASEPSRGQRLRAMRTRAASRRHEMRRSAAVRRQASSGAYTRRRVAAMIAAVAGVLLIWLLVAFFQPFAGKGEGEGQVIVNIPEGASAGEVADILSENDVVSNGTLFELRMRLAGKSDGILPGRHVLASGMSYGTAIDRLTGEASDGLVTLTIPEGLPRDQVAPIVEQAGIEGGYLAATKGAKGFNPKRYAATSKSLEGFLFPATYELEPGTGVQELVAQQLDAFRQNFARVDRSYAKSKNLTPYDVLIIASMVDREVAVPKERPLVAAVIYNRLSAGEPLGIDATTRYEYGSYEEQLTNEQLNADTPYNTRLNVGLPPTPIGNPGLASIKAAARPAKVDFRFFVVKPGTCGEHSFTASEAEFDRLAAEYQAALEEAGGSPTEC